jgi:hypothetical protein
MNRLLLIILFAMVTLTTVGCSHNYYNMPRETYEQKVRILGVAPIFVDAESDIRHPEKETLVALIKDFNRKNENELVTGIKNAGSYFSVTLLPDDPDKLFSNIFFRREKRDDAGIVYNKYFYKGPEIRDLISKNSVDALLLLVVSGLSVRENIYSSNLLAKLESDYNYLTISGQIIDAEGNILWEFPNFRQRHLSYPKFLALQYPDFDEARANETDKVEIKFRTIPGINRFLGKSSPSPVKKNASISDAYSAIFEEMVSMLRHPSNPFSGEKKENAAPIPATQPAAAPINTQTSPVNQPTVSTSPRSPSAVDLSQPSARPVSAQTPPASIVPPPGSPPAEPVASPSIAPAN